MNLKDERIKIGMSTSELEICLGKPDHINFDVGSIKREQWVYPDKIYFYFENDKLVGYSYTENLSIF